MDTKERKTPVVRPPVGRPVSVRRARSWRAAPPEAAKIELEKPELISRPSAKIFYGFSFINFALQ
jgi:hypothetical protein